MRSRSAALLLVLVFVLELASAGPACASDSGAPIRALLVTGGCCHDYGSQQLLLTQGISARANVTWTIVYDNTVISSHQVGLYTNADWAAGFDVVVHDECFGQVTDTNFVNGIAAAHSNGVPAVMLHCSIHSYRDSATDEWRKCLGLTSHTHEVARDISVTNVLPAHPVMRGFPTNWTDPSDELYKSEYVWPNALPLARARDFEVPATNQVVIWVNTYGSGRIFGTTLGHGNTTVSSSVYLDLVTRGMLWACRKLDNVSELVITSVDRATNGTDRLLWQSVPGYSYTFESAAQLDGPWISLPGVVITATNVLSSIVVTNGGGDQGFFRVRLKDP